MFLEDPGCCVSSSSYRGERLEIKNIKVVVMWWSGWWSFFVELFTQTVCRCKYLQGW